MLHYDLQHVSSSTLLILRRTNCIILRLKYDGTRAETRFRLSAKRTSPFKSAGASVQSTTGSRGVRIIGNNAGYTVFRGNVRVLATHSIRQFHLHVPSRASPCAIRFQLDSTTASGIVQYAGGERTAVRSQHALSTAVYRG